ncbi:MAG: STAS domain-containing protein [Actinobacteria bacterium]|nr:STAS domain-containing protein [Actinomycetota bacterium]
MTEQNASFDVRSAGGTSSIIDVHGDVTPACEDALMEAWTKASESSADDVIINFTDLEYMNSGGIGLLVTLLVRAQRQKQRLVAYGLSDHYRQIFELTRLDDAITICDDEDAALAAAS